MSKTKTKNAFFAHNFSVLKVFLIFLLGFFAFIFFSPERALADTTHNVTGYAWAPNFGWVNFSAVSEPNNVKINGRTGKITGYAWAPNGGWINFGQTYGDATVDTCTGKVSGNAWGPNLGWINFDLPNDNDEAKINTPTGDQSWTNAGRWSGYAWGPNAGWINFNAVADNSYSVETAGWPPQPDVNLDRPINDERWGDVDHNWKKVKFEWTPFDQNGFSQSKYRLQVTEYSDTGFANSVLKEEDRGWHSGTANNVTFTLDQLNPLVQPGAHLRWRVQIQNDVCGDYGVISPWSDSQSFYLDRRPNCVGMTNFRGKNLEDANNYPVPGQTVTLTLSGGGDPDGDDVYYDYSVYRLNEDGSIDERVYNDTLINQTNVTVTLPKYGTYAWFVIPIHDEHWLDIRVDCKANDGSEQLDTLSYTINNVGYFKYKPSITIPPGLTIYDKDDLTTTGEPVTERTDEQWVDVGLNVNYPGENITKVEIRNIGDAGSYDPWKSGLSGNSFEGLYSERGSTPIYWDLCKDLSTCTAGIKGVEVKITTDKTPAGYNLTDYINAPWLGTESGDVHSNAPFYGSIGRETSFDSPYYNATFVITANGTIRHFTSAQSDDDYVIENYEDGNLGYPNSEYSKFGNIDLEGLKSKCPSPGYCPFNWQSGEVGLKNNVYYKGKGDVTIGSNVGDLTFIKGGSGTLLVEGDLTINGNLKYDDTDVTNVEDLPSLGVIVTGNIYINKDVTGIVGSYIALGKSQVGGVLGGKISTTSSKTELSGAGLEVDGLMIAREFYFNRYYVGNILELVNPSFEEGSVHWTPGVRNVPVGESIPKCDSCGIFALESRYNLASPSYTATKSSFIPVDPGTEYTLSGWMKEGNGEIGIMKKECKKEEEISCNLADLPIDMDTKNTWDRRSITFTTTNETRYILLELRSTRTDTTPSYFDAIQLENGSQMSDFRVTAYPGEQVIYDGRVIANTPPGFESVESMMPEWEEIRAED